MEHLLLILALVLPAASVTITEPADGEIYNGDWLSLRALVTNSGEVPDSVTYSLNGSDPLQVARLNTDWYTYMANDLHTGYSSSPAPMENTVLWTASVTGDTHEFCSPVVVDGVVYFVSDEMSIAYALDAYTGDIIWQYDVIDHVDDAVTWYDDKVYIAADSAWCLNAATGERIWAFKPSPQFKMNGTPALNDGTAYFSFAPDYSSLVVCALDADNGAVKWFSLIPYYSTGCITFCDDVIYAPTYLGNLYALDSADGTILWENSDAVNGYWDSSPVVIDGVIYIGGVDGVFRGIDAQTGVTIWSTDICPGIRYIAATPAYNDGMLFFADQVDSFHSLNSTDGSHRWSVYGVQHGSPGLTEDVVFFGEGADRDHGKVRALSVETGDEIWSYQTGGVEIYSSPAITDGVVYIAGMDWNLYAFGSDIQYTFLGDLYAQTGLNELVVTSFDSGSAAAADTISFTVTGSGIEIQPTRIFNLQVSPTPFSTVASVGFVLPSAGNAEVTIHDLTGRQVSNLSNGHLPSGDHLLQWDGTQNGRPLPSGLYLCILRHDGISETAGVCLLR